MATPTDSPTGRNLAASRTVRLGLGHTRDASMIEVEVAVLEIERAAAAVLATPYRWFRISRAASRLGAR